MAAYDVNVIICMAWSGFRLIGRAVSHDRIPARGRRFPMALKFFPLTMLLGSAALLACTHIHGQTLQQRTPAAPAAPPSGSALQPRVPDKPVLTAGTSLQVETLRHYPMKKGIAIEGRLVYPLFADGKLALPENTLVHGVVKALEPDSKQRLQGRLQGDFTPFHIARVQFDELTTGGESLRFTTTGATTGATVLRLAAAGAVPKQSLIARQWALAKTRMHEQIAFFTDPGLGDRAMQMLYRQLPYHPERIPAHTSWTFELAEPLTLPEEPVESADPAPVPVPKTPGNPETWSVHALLSAEVSSATAKPGDPVRALVVEPVLDKDNQLVIPQGSVLAGHVTTAKPAHSFARNGKLRFTFQQVQFPEGTGAAAGQPVEGALAGATTQGAHTLDMDAEGTITPKNQSRVIAPLLLTLLAGRALDQDGNITAQTTVASNGFGLVGRIVGIAAGNRELAAGIGYYAAALSVYRNFLRSGNDVVFPKDTRIEILTTPLRAPVLKPELR